MSYTAKLNNEEFFTTNSDDGALALTSASVNLKAGGAGTFTFKVPMTNKFYKSFHKLIDWIDVYRNNELTPFFSGRVTDLSLDFLMNLTVTCEGLLTVLSDTIFRPITFSGTLWELVKTIIASHNEQVEDDKKIKIGKLLVEDAACYRAYEKYETSISRLQDLVDSFGGFLALRKESDSLYLDWYNDFIDGSDQIVNFGENLIDLTKEENSDDIVTVLIPLGSEDDDGNTLTIESVNDGKDYIVASEEYINTYGYIVKTKTWDDINTPSLLKKRAEDWMVECLTPKVTMEITAVDLSNAGYNIHNFAVGQKIKVTSPPHDINEEWFDCTKIELDLLDPSDDRLSLGDTKTGYVQTHGATSITKTIERSLSKYASKSFLQEAVESATNYIVGNKGGYVVLHDSDEDGEPDEILIMDTPSIETARKIWRWNNSGLGYSSTGYNGPYGLALTIDGSIVANYITSGVMNADLIRAGILRGLQGNNYWNLVTGELHIEGYATTEEINTLQSEIDNQIQTWTGEATPTLTNYPASYWGTDEERQKHVGDIYYTDSGKCYRFVKNGNDYSWKLITDTDLTKALSDATSALQGVTDINGLLVTDYYTKTETNQEITNAEGRLTSKMSSDYVGKTTFESEIGDVKTSVEVVEGKASTLEQTVDNFKVEVSNNYSTKIEMENAIGDVKIGGRNWLIYTADKRSIKSADSSATNTRTTLYYLNGNQDSPVQYHYLSDEGFKAGDEMILSFDWEVSDVSSYGSFVVQTNGQTASSSNSYNGTITDRVYPSAEVISGHVSKAFKLVDISSSYDVGTAAIGIRAIVIRVDNADWTLTFSNMKLEAGTKATSWSIAPEDPPIGEIGNNLIPRPYYREQESGDTYTSNGITWRLNSDGSVTANGTATDLSTYHVIIPSENSLILRPGSYSFSGVLFPGSGTTYRMSVYHVVNGYNTGLANEYGRKGTVFSITDKDDVIGVSCYIFAGYTANNLTFYPMIESGIKTHEYASYDQSVNRQVDMKLLDYYTKDEVDSSFTVAADSIEAAVNRVAEVEANYELLSIGATQMLPDTNVNSMAAVDGAVSRYFSDSTRTAITGEFFELTDPPVPGLKYGYRLTSTVSGASYGRGLTWRGTETTFNMIDGETYTLSVYARITSGTKARLRFRYYGADNIDTSKCYCLKDISNTVWQQHHFTFVYDAQNKNPDNPNPVVSPSGIIGSDICTVELCGMKLEKGNKPSAWSEIPDHTEKELIRSYSTTTETQALIKEASDSITASVSKDYATKEAVTEVKNTTITGETLHYLATSADSGVTTSTSGWTTSVQKVTSSKKYLWTYITYTYGDNTTKNTTPVITGVYGDTGAQGPQGNTGGTGATGTGITSVEPLYYAKANATAPSAPTSAVTSTSTAANVWTKKIPALSTSNPYLFTCDQVAYTDGSYRWTTVSYDNAYVELSERLTKAELKITDDSIISTVMESDKYVQSVGVTNLLPTVYSRENISGSTYTVNGITFTVNKDGSITATGTATGSAVFNITSSTLDSDVPVITIDPDKRYVLHGCPAGGSTSTYALRCRYTAAGTTPSGSTGSVVSDVGSGHKTTSARKYAYVYIAVWSGYACPSGGLKFYPMLEVGDTIHNYVSTHDGTGALTSRMSSAESSITQNANNIASKVSTTDYTGTKIASLINQSASSVLINAAHVNLQGAVTVSSFDDATQKALVTNTTTKNQYYLSTSASSATGGSWQDTTPSWSSGKYVWVRVATTKTYASGTSSTTYSTAVYDANLTTALSTASTASSTATTAKTTAETAVANTPVVNLLPSIYYREVVAGTTHTTNGITFTVNPNGSVTAKGTATDTAVFNVTGWTLSQSPPVTIIDPNKQYRLHGSPANGGTASYGILARVCTASETPDGTSAGTLYYDWGSGATIPTGKKYVQVHLRIASGYACPSAGITFYPMLETGTTSHNYVSTHTGTSAVAASSIKSTVSCYYRSTTNSTPTITSSTSIGTATDTSNAWEYVMPRPKKNCYFYTCERYTLADGSVTFSTVRAMSNLTYSSLWCSANDSTCIDGANIYAGSVTADKISVTDLTALKATIGGWTINTGKISGGTSSTGVAVMQMPSSSITWVFAAGGTSHDSYSDCPFRVDKSGNLYATKATITGNITATGGTIGGWSINSSMISKMSTVTAGTASTQYQAFMQATPSAESSHSAFCVRQRTYDGSAYGNWTNNFNVSYGGALYSIKGSIGGWSISDSSLTKSSTVTSGTASVQYQTGIYADASADTNMAIRVRQRNYTGSAYDDWVNKFYVRYDGYIAAYAGGRIGAWYIGSGTGNAGSLYSGMTSFTDTTNNGVWLGPQGIALGKGVFKVTNTGALTVSNITATGGTIGGFTIDSTSIHTKDVAVTSNASNSLGLSSSTFTRTINGSSRSNLKFAIGSNFGVTNTGVLYAGSANISGDVTLLNTTTTTSGNVKIGSTTAVDGPISYNGTALIITSTGTDSSQSLAYAKTETLSVVASPRSSLANMIVSSKQLLLVGGGSDGNGVHQRFEGTYVYFAYKSRTSTSSYSHKIGLDVSSGTITCNSINQTSDIHEKKKIKSLNRNGESDDFILYGLKPRQFVFRNDEKAHVHHGFIAQEVEECVKNDWDVVSINSDGCKSIAYTEIIADLVATVQSLNKRIQALERIQNGTL